MLKRVCMYIPLMSRYSRSGQSIQHRRAVLAYLEELKNDGWRAIDLHNKSPDGIAVKDGKIVAVEILLNETGGISGQLQKRREYFMFDDVLFKMVKRDYNEDEGEL